MPGASRSLLRWLGVLAAALMLVGVISGTILRHAVQILPIVLAAALAVRAPAAAAWAAVPLFGFWLFIVSLIWLFLAGLSSIANGTYTTAEIVLTLVMGVAAVSGLRAAIPAGRSLSVGHRALVAFAFAVLQVAAMWVSFLRPIAHR